MFKKSRQALILHSLSTIGKPIEIIDLEIYMALDILNF